MSREEVLDGAWSTLTEVSEMLRTESRGRPVKLIHRVKAPIQSASTNTDIQQLVRARNRQANIIRQEASEFLKENGFTTGGRARQQSPHTPKSQTREALEAELARLIALQKALNK